MFFIDSLFFLFFFIFIFLILILNLIMIAFFTLFERKLMASQQSRVGPNFTGFLGLLQPLADGAKLFLKETILPRLAFKNNFFLATFFIFFLSFLNLCFMPFTFFGSFGNMDSNLLMFFSISGLGSFGIILAGWSSFFNLFLFYNL